MALKGIIKLPKPNMQRVPRVYDKQVRELLKEAAKVFVTNAFWGIPKDTGMSRASMYNLAKHVGLQFPLAGKAKGGKSIAAGKRQSSFAFPREGLVYSFVWNTQVLQFFLNDTLGLPSNRGIPWNVIPRALQKALSKIQNEALQLNITVKATCTQVENIGMNGAHSWITI